MAIIPENDYAAQVISGDPGWPYGKAKNETSPGLKNGTPLEERWVSDNWGFLQALLDRAGITPSGSPDKVGASQYLDALDFRFGGAVNLTSITSELQNGLASGRIFDVNAVESAPRGAVSSADGSKLYVLGSTADEIHQYAMSEPFDQDTAVFESSWSQGLLNNLRGLAWKPDGTMFFTVGTNLSDTAREVRSWTPVTPWSVLGGVASTAAFVTPEFSSVYSVNISPDGGTLYVGGKGTLSEDFVVEYDLATPWAVNTGTETHTLTIGVGVAEVYLGHAMSQDGRRLFSCSATSVTEYHLATPYRLASAFSTNRNKQWVDRLGVSCYPPIFTPGDAHAFTAEFGGTKIMSIFTSAVRVA